MAKRINKKHFIIFNNGGVISSTTPKNWARAHQGCFPNKNFSNSDDTPTVEEIENYLIQHLDYKKLSNDEIVVCYDYKAI
ncbi:hypothetical protein ASG38_05590 [Flavobacterium sp. Leaf359]|uniref:hypothetical protein n=1 Tax=Flavobacterium sp. Leaf359 TaxID=1736351 RepID=UPI0006F35679|nr:hypothetical protein [Flavobacterium sp. Leaf359]KQS48612.1 hypothetical protein ASG38_05590 [Flavobacterium sp. Leaf359]